MLTSTGQLCDGANSARTLPPARSGGPAYTERPLPGQWRSKVSYNGRRRASPGDKFRDDRGARMDGRRWVRAMAFVVLAWAAPAGEAAGDSYYAIVFGSQTHPKVLRFTHTWATFVRVADSAIPG